MFKILKKQELNDVTTLMVIYAPNIAKKALAGQFIILRVDDNGERIPLTICEYSRENGTITIIFQKVGCTTKKLGNLNEGDCIKDFVGPLGVPSKLDHIKKAIVIGGGLGVAIAYPQAKTLKQKGKIVDTIVGFRNESLIILENELLDASSNLYVVTDDGSNGHKGFVTNVLQTLLEKQNDYDEVIAIGPVPMMKAVCEITKKYNVKTVVSMNSTMIDGTGMCGCCRLTVDGKTKFACVDGPDFDGHLIDFDEAIMRSKMFKQQEKISLEKMNG